MQQLPTEDQVRLFEGLSNVRLKIFVTRCMMAAFFIILFYVLFWPAVWQTKTALSTLDGIIAITIRPMINHFFPAVSSTKKLEKENPE